MNFNKIGKTLDRMMGSNPVLTSLGVLACGVPVALIIVWVVMYAPTLAMTIGGVILTWIIVLFISKFIKEMQR